MVVVSTFWDAVGEIFRHLTGAGTGRCRPHCLGAVQRFWADVLQRVRPLRQPTITHFGPRVKISLDIEAWSKVCACLLVII